MQREYARRLAGYTRWADGRLLDAAAKLPPAGFETIREPLLHMLGTYTWWESLWAGTESAEPSADTVEAMRAAYAVAHDALEARFSATDEAALAVAKAWWERWGEPGSLPVADTLMQVAMHGVQHRSEIAVLLTDAGCSPGDLDYLNYIVPIVNAP